VTVNFSARPGNTAGGLLDVLRIAEVK
jgi:hypothetical protein